MAEQVLPPGGRGRRERLVRAERHAPPWRLLVLLFLPVDAERLLCPPGGWQNQRLAVIARKRGRLPDECRGQQAGGPNQKPSTIEHGCSPSRCTHASESWTYCCRERPHHGSPPLPVRLVGGADRPLWMQNGVYQVWAAQAMLVRVNSLLLRAASAIARPHSCRRILGADSGDLMCAGERRFLGQKLSLGQLLKTIHI
jgi:hypothetical protein